MTELVELISSLTVFVAALAGISAINKWKRERFDKAKIDAIEEYESCLRNVNKEFDSLLKDSPVYYATSSDGIMNDNIKQLELYLEHKKGGMESLKLETDKAEHSFDVYSGYAGNNLSFVNNYYQSNIILMESALLGLEIEILRLNSTQDESLSKKEGWFLFSFIKSDNNGFGYEEYMMLSYASFLSIMSDVDKKIYVDRRRIYEDSFKRIVSAEKMALHTPIYKKIFIRIKIFIMKCKLAGRVLHMTKNSAMIVSSNGAIYRVNAKGRKYNEIEESYRKNIVANMFKAEISRLFT